ncbi:MAG TPA: zinc ribbon domain-containing protein [Candidatus Limnocylindrales bacterium]|nr:zinc ribbon domain-containing protein [Candidatus Limnocylindrales bacterium]
MFEDAAGIGAALAAYAGLVVVACWVAMIVWTFRDMRARSRDTLAQLLMALMVALLTIPGVLIYLFLRPRETLAEAYERSLEEEALLQEIEEKPTCPGCKQRVKEEWQACPHCHTRLGKPCTRCGRMLELSWDICPYCITATAPYVEGEVAASATRMESAPTASAWAAPLTAEHPRMRASRRAAAAAQAVEFVDGEDV